MKKNRFLGFNGIFGLCKKKKTIFFSGYIRTTCKNCLSQVFGSYLITNVLGISKKDHFGKYLGYPY